MTDPRQQRSARQSLPPIPPPPGAARLAAPPPTRAASDRLTVLDSSPSPPQGNRSGRTVWIALGVAAAVLLIGGGALLGYALTRSDDDQSVTATDAESTETTAPAKSRLEGRPVDDGDSMATTPSTAAPATAPPSTPPATVTARVSRTCGANGTGDCYVALRAGPSTSGPELARMNEGSTITLDCQQRGESVRASALGYSTDVWARSTDGRWLAMAFLDAPGWSLTDITVPC